LTGAGSVGMMPSVFEPHADRSDPPYRGLLDDGAIPLPSKGLSGLGWDEREQEERL
jgi:hypothetical protein